MPLNVRKDGGNALDDVAVGFALAYRGRGVLVLPLLLLFVLAVVLLLDVAAQIEC